MDKKPITLNTNCLSEENLSAIYKELSLNFDNSLLRLPRSQLKALKHQNYKISYIDNIGMSLWWLFDEFAFIEYLMIKEEHRNKGFGCLLLDEIKTYGKCTIVEVEVKSSVANFYKKNGFKQCLIKYVPVQINENPQEGLFLMSYDHMLSKDEFNRFMKKIRQDDLQF